ncbi:unnamed protein product, partial [Prunus brigantina]
YIPITHHSIYLNGFLYWIGWRRRDASFFMSAFHIERELFQELPLPPCHVEIINFSLQVLRGWLSFIVGSRGDINVWVMKESWTKEHEIRDQDGFNIIHTRILRL